MPEKSSSEIEAFIQLEAIDYADVFQMIDVNGGNTHPLYRFLKSKKGGVISWNFTKFVVDRNAEQIDKFSHLIVAAIIENAIQKFV